MKKPDNTELILDGLIAQRNETLAPAMKADEFFEVFVAEVLLAQSFATLEEIMAGIVGGGGDGGIDAFYLYLNGQPILTMDDLPESVPSASRIELILIQAKRTPRFGEDVIRNFETTTGHLFQLADSLDAYKRLYSGALLEAADRFRKTYERSMTAFPTLLIRCLYVSKGNAETIHPAVKERASFLERNLRIRFPDCEARLEFIGARELLARARRGEAEPLQLSLAETAISTERGGYVALVQLDRYYEFLVDEDGQLRQSLFDYNVRDYEGPSVTVNRAIRETLEGESRYNDDFWWLNNGVSIVADTVSLAGKTLNMRTPKIVNGLQTSMEIYLHYTAATSGSRTKTRDDRAILVRVVTPPDDKSRDRIIKATNSQSLIPGIALHSTEEIHLDIEEFFAQNQLWYERRQNKYRNEGRPLNQIVTISTLAEAVLAVVYSEPHLGNPRLGGRFLRDDANVYKSIFEDSISLLAYLNSVLVVHYVLRYLDSLERKERSEYGKLAYLAATAVSVTYTRSWNPGSDLVAELDMSSIESKEIAPLFRALRSELDDAQRELGVSERDSPVLRTLLLQRIREHCLG